MTRVEWLDHPSDDEWRSIATVINEYWREVIAGDPARPWDELAAAVRDVPDYRTASIGIALDGDDIVGATELVLEDFEGHEDHGWIKYLAVRRDHRHRGLGQMMLAAAVERTRSMKRVRLVHSASKQHADATRFAQAAGARPTLVYEQNRLCVADLDRTMLETWVHRAAERATNYSLVAFDGVCPDEWIEPFARVIGVMNDAPRSDASAPIRMTPEEVRDNMQAFARQGHLMWTVCALDETTGEFGGFTELAFSPYRPSLANQGDTGVHVEHRERGLGRWLKATNALRALVERPEVTAIDTWNAGTNAAMLSINHEMGFRPVAEWQEWELVLS